MPRLNVKSDSLVSLFGVPLQINWIDFKNDMNAKIGGLVFIETFEGWQVDPIRNVILQFRDDICMMKFINELEANKIFMTKVQYEIVSQASRFKFFENLRCKTGVDLLKCAAIPPATRNRRRPDNRAWENSTIPPSRPFVLHVQQNQQRSASQQWSSKIQREKTCDSRQVSPSSDRSIKKVPSLSSSVFSTCPSSSSNFVLIKEVSDKCSKEDLKSLAEECGNVLSLELDVQAKFEYFDEAVAERAVSILNNRKINGNVMQAHKCSSSEELPDSTYSSKQDLIDLNISNGRVTNDRGRTAARSVSSVEMRGVSPFNYVPSQMFPVILKNIPESCSDFDLLNLAEEIGKLAGSYLNRQAIVGYRSKKEAEKAVITLNNRSFKGSVLGVQEYWRNLG